MKNPFQVSFTCIFKFSDVSDARAVYQNINVPRLGQNFGSNIFYHGLVRYVAGMRGCFSTGGLDGANGFLCRFRIQLQNKNSCSLLGEEFSDPLANSAATTGDNCS